MNALATNFRNVALLATALKHKSKLRVTDAFRVNSLRSYLDRYYRDRWVDVADAATPRRKAEHLARYDLPTMVYGLKNLDTGHVLYWRGDYEIAA